MGFGCRVGCRVEGFRILGFKDLGFLGFKDLRLLGFKDLGI